MKNHLRQKFKARQPTHGLWVTLEAPTLTEIAVTMGLDWVCVEMEHGHLDFGDVMEHIRTVRGSQTTILVRVSENQQGLIKRILDMGAHGVVVPLIQNAAEVEQAVRYGKYPMRGVRGLGGERAVKWGLGMDDYLSYANEETLIIPMIETKGSADDIDAILNVPGVEAIFFGPADFSATYGYLGQWEGPGLADKILEIRAKAEKKGIASGIMSRSVEDSLLRQKQGFDMIGIGSDAGLLIRSLNENLKQLGVKTTPHLWF